MKYSFVIPDELDNERLDKVIALRFDLSRAHVVDLIKKGLVQCGDTVVSQRSIKVVKGQQYEVDLAERQKEIKPSVQPIDIVYSDEHLLVVNKPAHLVTHRSPGHRDDSMIQRVMGKFPELQAEFDSNDERPGVVHRLDKGTSGLLLVAKNQVTKDALSLQIFNREVEREYITLVWGRFQNTSGTIDAPIGRSTSRRKNMAIKHDGRAATTHYVVLDYSPELDVSLIKVRLETGRTHQIRVHLSAIGHRVVGDSAYMGSKARLSIDRPFLHSWSLGFVHPSTAAPMSFTAGLPEDLRACLTKCGIDKTF